MCTHARPAQAPSATHCSPTLHPTLHSAQHPTLHPTLHSTPHPTLHPTLHRYIQALLRGEDLATAGREIRAKVLGIWAKAPPYWAPLDLINFSLVSSHWLGSGLGLGSGSGLGLGLGLGP